jgi:hypothetical protein|tara:strand:+ start:4083 stop:4265 length:183 start_codon:yes stop_codon:yes gene_type:complete
MKIEKFKVIRRKIVFEECFVQAVDYVHAERLGEEEQQNWQKYDTEYEIIAAIPMEGLEEK